MSIPLLPNPTQELNARLSFRRDARESVAKWIDHMTHNGLKTFVAMFLGNSTASGSLALSMRIEELEARRYRVRTLSQSVVGEEPGPVYSMLFAIVIDAPPEAGLVLGGVS